MGDGFFLRRKICGLHGATLLPELQRIAVALDGHPDLPLCGNTKSARHFGTNSIDLAL